MAFLIYDVVANERGRHYRHPKRLEVNRLAAALIDYLRSQNAKQADIFTWHVNQNDVLENLGFNPQNHAFLIDVKPEVKKNVSLCSLRDIWGYSNEWWTPVLIRLESIFMDKKHEDPSIFKQSFNVAGAEREILHEVLYLGAGTTHGKRRWGKTGYVNAALLSPKALDYFCSVLKENPF